jgi:ribulose-phosphate 3-epimerase
MKCSAWMRWSEKGILESMNYPIAASMSCANPIHIQQDFERLEQSVVSAYHFDLCDGLFAPTFLLNPAVIGALRPLSRKRFDVHLYCHYPSRYLEELKKSGADIVVVHVEAEGENYLDVIRQIRGLGMQAGVGILPTSILPDNIDEALELVSLVVANTVGPAYAGQPFNPDGLRNSKNIREKLNARGMQIEVAADGSVAAPRLPAFLQAGYNHFICGTSSIFKPGLDLVDGAEQFKQALDQALASQPSTHGG